jgi:hypothetical protein
LLSSFQADKHGAALLVLSIPECCPPQAWRKCNENWGKGANNLCLISLCQTSTLKFST